MKLPRRKFLLLAAGAAALPVQSRRASALDYPTRPVHLVVAFPPGGGADFVPGYEAAGWQGIGAPKDTPDAIVEKLNAATDAVLADPAIKARPADMAITPYPSTPAEFAALIAGETQKWGKVIRDAGIKPE